MDLSSLSDGEVLTYEVASEKWKNKATAAGVERYRLQAGTDITSVTSTVWDWFGYSSRFADVDLFDGTYKTKISANLHNSLPTGVTYAKMVYFNGSSWNDLGDPISYTGMGYEAVKSADWVNIPSDAELIAIQVKVSAGIGQINGIVFDISKQ